MASFLVIKAHLSPDLPVVDGDMDQAGTGGARSRPKRANIYRNILPDTATSAISKVT